MSDRKKSTSASKAELSIEARCIAACFFLFNEDCEVIFQRPHILTQSARAGLDELVARGLAEVSTDKRSGAMTWTGKPGVGKVAQSISHAEIKRNSFPLTTE